MSVTRHVEPTAIVGMGCRWSGGVRDVKGLWEFLVNKRSGYQDWGAIENDGRFSAKGFYHPNPDRPGTTAAKGGYVVTDDPRLFDPSFFGISGLEAETIDPSQRKLLEVIYEAFESAGDTWESVNGTRTGVYVADISYDNAYAQTKDWEYARPHATTGVCHNVLSNRINYIFNLHGPSVTIDSACTSALYGLHMAIQAIRDGDCDSAIVATSNYIMDPAMQIAMDKLGALSATSMSHAFDASADGYARGEGFAAIYLKKPEKAMLDGSPIRALVRGSAIGANGRSSGITHPSGTAQEEIIRKAYENAGSLRPSETPFLECHGTGTRVGDPLEVEAAGKVFGPGRSNSKEDRLLIGSVKTNLGHTEGAAALAGIFKAVLALEAGVIPPSIGVKTLNPRIDFDKAKAEVVTEVVPWPEGKLRRASVTSAGFGGSIGHCILDHVNVVYPAYVKPGIIDNARLGAGMSKVSAVSNGWSNGHTDGHVNGYMNGHTNGFPNGHTNGHPVGLSNGHTNGHAIQMPNGQKNGHINGLSNGHTSIQTNGQTNGHLKDHLDRHSDGYPTMEHLPILRALKAEKHSDAGTRHHVLLPFSAHSDSSLKANINALSQAVDQHSLADVAYTLAARRSRLSQRTFRVVDAKHAAQNLLEPSQAISASPSETQRLGFVFTGQGAQWPAMGAQLFDYHIFRHTIEHLDSVLSTLPEAPIWKIEDVLSGKSEPDLVHKSEVSQTVCTAVQIGIVELLASWSVYPSAVVGHSSGEMAAAYAAGRMTAAESIVAAFFRGNAVSRNKKVGAMLAVGLDLEQVVPYLDGHDQSIKVAAVNSPVSLTLSGDKEAVEKLSATLTQEGVFNRLLKTGGNAYHSHHMLALGHDYAEMLSQGLIHLEKIGLHDTRGRYPSVPWFSSVTPEKSTLTETVPASYWRSNLESPVRFSDAVANLVGHEELNIGALVEIGPHPALKGPSNQTLKGLGKTLPYLGSLKRGEDGQISLLQLAGSLFCLNAEVDLTAVNAIDERAGGEWALVHGVTATDLPPYQYTYGPISYYEGRASKEFRLRTVQRHDLIGSKVAGNAKLRPQFRNVLRMKDLPWLSDHRLLPDVVFPAAGYMCMAMVAASQIHEELPDASPIAGYSLRNVDIKTALKIPEDAHGIETILSMEIADMATATAPAWISFSVSSVTRDTDKWTEHCTGLVKVNVSNQLEAEKLALTAESRAVNARSWYKKFTSIGLGYGNAFQALSEIRADPNRNVATAKLRLKTTMGVVKGGESSYPIHPASLDAMIQLGLLSCCGGQTDKATSAFVPIRLSSLDLGNQIDRDWATATAGGNFRGLRSAYLQLQLHDQDGNLLLSAQDLRCTRYSLSQLAAQTQGKTFASPFTRMVYKPDFRVLSKKQARALFPPPPENVAQVAVLDRLEEMAALITVDVYESLINGKNYSSSPSQTVTYYAGLIKRLFEEEVSLHTSNAKQLHHSKRLQLLQDRFREQNRLIDCKVLQRLHENMVDLFQNNKTGEDILSEGGLLADFFDNSLFLTGSHAQISNLFASASHANPNLRILELKAGRSRTAQIALETLSSTNGIKRYQDYTVTDVSETALETARAQLAGYHDVKFSVLDIQHDPLQQGQQPVYDVVFASQALHTASSIAQALGNIRRLLKPGGKLVLAEAIGGSAWVSLIGGAQAGFWHGVSDGRLDGPFLDKAAWDTALRSAGFSGAEIELDDYPHPNTQSSVIVSTLLNSSRQTIDSAKSPVVQLLHGAGSPPPLLDRLAVELKRRGQSVTISSIDKALNEVTTDSRVVAFLDGENLLLDADQNRLSLFQHLAHSTASMVWLTSTGFAKGRNPDGAVLGGLLRNISTEAPMGRFFSIDIDADGFNLNDEGETDELVRVIADREQTLQQSDDEESNDDREFCWHSGCLWVSRLVPEDALSTYNEPFTTPATHGTELLPIDSQGPVRAAFETPGVLNSLYFRPATELGQQPLACDHIEVKVAAMGLNWKDLALSNGRFDGNNLSSEYSGIVTRVGTDVAGQFIPGDHVYGLGKGHFGNFVQVPAGLAQKALPADDLTDVASMPVIFMTAVYAFEYLTRLRKGQTVLIQSASGGVGLAAIQMAHSKGAEVFAVASSEDKRKFLIESVGLPPSHVFDIRDSSQLTRVVNTTHNGGFDIILSTAHGDLLYRTIQALAPLGHLIDIGRLDVNESKSVGLELFQKNASFSSFDLGRVVESDPELGSELIQAVNKHFRTGTITPVRPLSASDISQLDKTLLAFSKGEHVGKLVVTFQDPTSLVRMVPAKPQAKFDPEACYVITGGLSGLGRSIIQWMGDRGARKIVVLSRRGGSAPEAQTLVDTLSQQGISVVPTACDLSKPEQVAKAIEQASTIGSVKGIVHCAVSYQDVSFNKITADGWRDGLAAKVVGTRNLHEATKSLTLDFFVMTTSILSVLSFATQGAYTAANNFQDAFARYRHRQGLPATAAQFGLVNDVGHLSTDTTTLDLMTRNKVLTLPESHFLRLLEPAFLGCEAPECSAVFSSDPLAAATYVTYMDPAQMADKERDDMEMGLRSAAPPRWYSDARVSHVIRGFEDALRHSDSDDKDGGGEAGSGRSAVSQLRREFDEAVKEARVAPAGGEEVKARTRAVELTAAAISGTVATMLVLDPSSVNTSRSVSDHGIDSLIAAELRNWFHLAFASKISMVDLLEPRTSIAALAARVVDDATKSEGK